MLKYYKRYWHPANRLDYDAGYYATWKRVEPDDQADIRVRISSEIYTLPIKSGEIKQIKSGDERKLNGFGKHLTQIVTSRKISYRLMHCTMHIQNLAKVNK